MSEPVRYRTWEAVVFTPKEDHRAFTPLLVAGMPVVARYYRRVRDKHWLDLPEYGGRARSIVVADADEVTRVADTKPIAELRTVQSVGPHHLQVTGVHSQEAMAALHEELTGREAPEDAGRLALPPGDTDDG